MHNASRAGLVAVAIVGAAMLYRRAQQSAGEVDSSWSIFDDVQSIAGTGLMMAGLENWRAPDKYQPAVRAAEIRHGIPLGLLEALLYTESAYRESVINGTKKSRVGALGIAQFMPATAAEMGIDPLEPYSAIDAAGRYLARLYKSTSDWGLALAAYNWGLGNLQRKGIRNAPLETRNYYNRILAAVGGAGSVLA